MLVEFIARGVYRYIIWCMRHIYCYVCGVYSVCYIGYMQWIALYYHVARCVLASSCVVATL